MPSQSFTFFFTADLHRATDRSQAPIWSQPGVSVSAPVKSFGWVQSQPA
jgi:hypothetical protein